jgi:hypothetical protein
MPLSFYPWLKITVSVEEVFMGFCVILGLWRRKNKVLSLSRVEIRFLDRRTPSLVIILTTVSRFQKLQKKNVTSAKSLRKQKKKK